MNTIDSPIRGTTKILGLLGDPVAHSLSPQIHNHAIRQLGLDYVYIPIPVKHDSIHIVLHALRAISAVGFNVTIPHKQQVVHYCDELSELSGITGTVNTLHFNNNRLCGTTTDFEGFKQAVGTMGFDFAGSNVIILGNGGTAQTIATALALEKKIKSLTIAGRNRDRVAELARFVISKTNFPVSVCLTSDPLFRDYTKNCSLLVNTTSAGMHPNENETPFPAGLFHKNMFVFDAIYNPAKTRFLQEAEMAGCTIQNGLRMLLFQGLASFKIWTGYDVPENIYSIEYLQGLIGKKP
jgi:shikimate dehydrogenase